jgi:hypothetical protein
MFASIETALNTLGRVEGFGIEEIAKRLTYVSGADTPSNTSTVPEFIGQHYFDTANEIWYIAVDTANAADFKRVTN